MLTNLCLWVNEQHFSHVSPTTALLKSSHCDLIIQSPAHKLFSRPPRYMANDSHHTVTVTHSLALSSTATGHWDMCSLDFNNFIFSLNFRAAQSLTAQLCAVASLNVFIFCDSSCGSWVAATWTLFSYYSVCHFRCDTEVACSSVIPSHQILAMPLLTCCTKATKL